MLVLGERVWGADCRVWVGELFKEVTSSCWGTVLGGEEGTSHCHGDALPNVMVMPLIIFGSGGKLRLLV